MEIVLMNDNAIIPTTASKESAGLDLYSSTDIDIEVGLIKKVNTGICIPEFVLVKFLKDTERDNKGFGEMDEVF